MKWLLRAAVRLYPHAWRDRYGEELDALLEDMTPRVRHVVNIAVGALIMQISRPSLVPVAAAVIGSVVGAAISLAMPPMYASSSWVIVQAPSADGDDRGRRIRTAIDATLQQTAFDKKAIAVTMHGEPGREPVLLEVSASADSAQTAQQAALRAIGMIIDANFVASERLVESPLVQMRVVQPPPLPSAAQRETTRNSAVGGAAGLLAGTVVTLVARRRQRTTA